MQAEYKKSKSKIDADRKRALANRKEQSEQDILFGNLPNANDKYISRAQNQQAVCVFRHIS